MCYCLACIVALYDILQELKQFTFTLESSKSKIKDISEMWQWTDEVMSNLIIWFTKSFNLR